MAFSRLINGGDPNHWTKSWDDPSSGTHLHFEGYDSKFLVPKKGLTVDDSCDMYSLGVQRLVIAEKTIRKDKDK